jgi:hypothetical protein
MKKDAEKAKKEAREHAKLQQGSDEEAVEYNDDNDGDVDEEQEKEWDDIPWDELVHDDDAAPSI